MPDNDDTAPTLLDDLERALATLRVAVGRLAGYLGQAAATADDRVREWRLYSGEEYGGVYCAQPGCGCDGHSSEIIPGGEPADTDEQDATLTEGRFTIGELADAVSAHIAYRDDRRLGEPR